MRIRHLAAPLALAIALFFTGVETRAQTHAPATQAEPAPPEGSHATTGEQSGAHGSEAGTHHGPEIKLFGASLGQLGQFLVKLVNFSIFFAILYFLLKGALSSAFKARTRELEEQLSQAEMDKAEGEAQLKALEVKMAGMQAELAGIMAKAAMEAESEKERILEAARAEATLILAHTRTEIEFQKRIAEKELRALVAELAIEGAVKRLEGRLQGATAEHVLDRAIEVVGGAK